MANQTIITQKVIRAEWPTVTDRDMASGVRYDLPSLAKGRKATAYVVLARQKNVDYERRGRLVVAICADFAYERPKDGSWPKTEVAAPAEYAGVEWQLDSPDSDIDKVVRGIVASYLSKHEIMTGEELPKFFPIKEV